MDSVNILFGSNDRMCLQSTFAWVYVQCVCVHADCGCCWEGAWRTVLWVITASRGTDCSLHINRTWAKNTHSRSLSLPLAVSHCLLPTLSPYLFLSHAHTNAQECKLEQNKYTHRLTFTWTERTRLFTLMSKEFPLFPSSHQSVTNKRKTAWTIFIVLAKKPVRSMTD